MKEKVRDETRQSSIIDWCLDEKMTRSLTAVALLLAKTSRLMRRIGMLVLLFDSFNQFFCQ
jgi:hypothetical protein